jgi:hypothetical protein
MAYSICGWFNGIPSYINNNTDNEVNYIHTKYGSVYTGVKWQCVEFVRRYLILRYGITFETVKNVYELKNTSNFYFLMSGSPLPVHFYNTGFPMVNDILILSWKDTGHVAIVCNVDQNKGLIYTVDQNSEPEQWDTETYSRVYSIHSKQIMGWMRT